MPPYTSGSIVGKALYRARKTTPSTKKTRALTKQSNERLILIYPGGTDSCHIHRKDLLTVEDRTGWLNDNIINFAFRRWHLHKCDPRLADDIHIFSSHFYKKLCVDGYDSIRKWTNKVDIFQKKFLVFPINVNESHWILAIVTNPGSILLPAPNQPQPHIAYAQPPAFVLGFDSLLHDRIDVLEKLHMYLQSEALDKRGLSSQSTTAPTKKMVKTPHQGNLWDCGIHVLHNAWVFLDFEQELLPPIIEGKNPNPEHWKPALRAERRYRLKNIIRKMARGWRKAGME